MSRIAGILSKNKEISQAWLNPMLAANCAKVWQNKTLSSGIACLGACSWLLPNKAQSNGTIAVMDGAIYNRNELGCASTDAELICQLYSRFGFEETLTKINGDFAVALYDPFLSTLFLARDRFGLKPLYYILTNGVFAFASRLRSLLVLPWVSREVNHEYVAVYAASHYRYFDNRPENSPFKDINQLAAAHLLQYKNGNLRTSAFWGLEEMQDFDDPEEDLAERYRELLFDAVHLRYRTAASPAFTLSGGMDSSSVLAATVNITGNKQHAFSSVYKDKTYDETDDISSMLDTKVKEWHPIVIDTPDLFDTVRRMIEVHDEPVATATWLSHFLLCEEAAAQGFGSLFGGLGGDELNAGEYEYFFYHFADLFSSGLHNDLEEEIGLWLKYHDHPIYKKSRALVEDAFDHIIDKSKPGICFPEKNRMTKYYHALNSDYFDIKSFTPIMDHPFKSYLKNRSYQDIFRETAPCCLRAQDRHTVAYGMDNILPFFDHRLVEFMFGIPGRLKIRKGVTKHLLRMAMRGILPEETRRRIKKTGWNAPAHIWFSGKRIEPLMDMVRSQKFKQRGIYNIGEVERIIHEHEDITSSGAPKENHMMFLWQLVNLELWMEFLSSYRCFQ